MADQSVSGVGGFFVRWIRTAIEEAVAQKSREARDTYTTVRFLWERIVDDVEGSLSAVKYLAPYVPQALHEVVSSLPSMAIERSRQMFFGAPVNHGMDEEITAAPEGARFIASEGEIGPVQDETESVPEDVINQGVEDASYDGIPYCQTIPITPEPVASPFTCCMP